MKAIVIGASSGIGRQVTEQLLAKGWALGIAARRTDRLEEIAAKYPGQVIVQQLDVTANDASENLVGLFESLGHVDVFFLASGVGHQNPQLDISIDLATVEVNVRGFVTMVDTAYHQMAMQGGGRIAVISSIAGTKGLGVAAAYSATKRFQNTYIDALDQLSRMRGAGVRFTDIRPGFVRTDLLNDGKHYPMLMDPQRVARIIVRALERGRRVVTIDWRYRILVSLWRMIPRCLWSRLNISTR